MSNIITAIAVMTIMFCLVMASIELANAEQSSLDVQCFSDDEITIVREEVKRQMQFAYDQGVIDANQLVVNDVAKLCEEPGAYIVIGNVELKCVARGI